MWMFLGSLKPCQCLDLLSVLRFCRLQHRSSEHRHVVVVVVVVCLPGASSLPTSAVHNHWAHGPISPAAHTRPHHSGASHPGGLARAGLDCRLPPFWREDGRRRTRGHPAADQSHASRSWRATKVSAGRAVIHQHATALFACLVTLSSKEVRIPLSEVDIG